MAAVQQASGHLQLPLHLLLLRLVRLSCRVRVRVCVHMLWLCLPPPLTALGACQQQMTALMRRLTGVGPLTPLQLSGQAVGACTPCAGPAQDSCETSTSSSSSRGWGRRAWVKTLVLASCHNCRYVTVWLIAAAVDDPALVDVE